MRQCLVSRSRRVKAAPHRHEYGFSLVSTPCISYDIALNWATQLEAQTRSEVARQVFCSLEAPGAIGTGMGESVHVDEVCWR